MIFPRFQINPAYGAVAVTSAPLNTSSGGKIFRLMLQNQEKTVQISDQT